MRVETIGCFWLLLVSVASFLDSVLGDPFGNFHPVVVIGKLISFLTRKLNRDGNRKAKGFLLVCIVLSAVTGTTIFFEYLLWRVNFYLYLFINLWFLSTALAQKSLVQAGERVGNALKEGNLQNARLYTGYIVGRDTSRLGKTQIIRATVETIAENGIDGVIAPYFYILLGILPALYTPFVTPLVTVYLYKSVNTMDSMIGYTDFPYTDFGFCAAKLDDIANYLPARLGSWLYLLAGKLCGYDASRARRTYKKYKNAHASPNAGHPESAVAGLLGVQLGGNNVYFGNLHEKETIGENRRVLEIQDIARASKIVSTAQRLLLILTFLLFIVCLL